MKRAARSSLPILLRGPTGSGKEFAARAIHQASARPGPFIPVNMGALTLGLSQSELFGSVRGSYTGAHIDRAGLFEAANGGTILPMKLVMPPHIQVELLRILETKEVRRLGATHATRLDFRIIAATHQPLEHHISKVLFARTYTIASRGLRSRFPHSIKLRPTSYRCLKNSYEKSILMPGFQATQKSILWPMIGQGISGT